MPFSDAAKVENSARHSRETEFHHTRLFQCNNNLDLMAFRRGLIRIRSSICNTSDARNDVLENNAAQHKEYQHRITVDH